jgi:hypothetical protein
LILLETHVLMTGEELRSATMLVGGYKGEEVCDFKHLGDLM